MKKIIKKNWDKLISDLEEKQYDTEADLERKYDKLKAPFQKQIAKLEREIEKIDAEWGKEESASYDKTQKAKRRYEREQEKYRASIFNDERMRRKGVKEAFDLLLDNGFEVLPCSLCVKSKQSTTEPSRKPKRTTRKTRRSTASA